MKILFSLHYDFMALYLMNKIAPWLQENDISFTMLSALPPHKKRTLHHFEVIERIIPFDVLMPFSNTQSPEILSYETLAKRYNSDYRMVKTINDDASCQLIAQHDLVLSIRFPLLFKTAALDNTPKHGIINLHSAILPDYKGVQCTYQALLNKDKHIGTTLHYIDATTIDTGDIIQRIYVDADYNKTYFYNILNLYKASYQPIIDIIHAIMQRQPLNIVPQDTQKGNYYSCPTFEEFENFHQNIMPIYNQNDIMMLKNMI